MKQGALIFDERTDRYDIRFNLADYYGGLHCGQCQNGAPAKSQIFWGEEEQGSERSFRRKAETELSGLCDDEMVGGRWRPTRIEYAADWYLVGIRADELNGLRVRI